ncbi:unnamed protein product [Arabis nemorensis]|uniref:Complex III subunit VI n=1 Tax=Arabis nemorensis TaxID=586526 RepID=A0A565BQP9_9BRAS|nr:unnamed protein product [Arabis nemorensis]
MLYNNIRYGKPDSEYLLGQPATDVTRDYSSSLLFILSTEFFLIPSAIGNLLRSWLQSMASFLNSEVPPPFFLSSNDGLSSAYPRNPYFSTAKNVVQSSGDGDKKSSGDGESTIGGKATVRFSSSDSEAEDVSGRISADGDMWAIEKTREEKLNAVEKNRGRRTEMALSSSSDGKEKGSKRATTMKTVRQSEESIAIVVAAKDEAVTIQLQNDINSHRNAFYCLGLRMSNINGLIKNQFGRGPYYLEEDDDEEIESKHSLAYPSDFQCDPFFPSLSDYPYRILRRSNLYPFHMGKLDIYLPSSSLRFLDLHSIMQAADEEAVDQKKYLEQSCKPKCVKPLLDYQACVKRIQDDESGHKHCTGQYFDYWHCVDKCVGPKLLAKLN